MNVGGVHVGRLAPELIDASLAAARRAEPTYSGIGQTLAPDPCGREVRATLGRGAAGFDVARAGLRSWVTHGGIPATVHPVGEQVTVGSTVVVVLRIGPIAVLAPNRIVAVVDEPRRFAYAYGTLPGHPERGEESFTVELLDDGTVRGTVRVLARPATAAARLGAPVVWAMQRIAVRRYLAALADHVRRTNG